MVLGMARKLNQDGVGLRSVGAAWLNRPGMDSQYKAFTQGRFNNMTVEEAMRSTFSGKLAHQFGFTEMSVWEPDPGVYIVRFERPS
jgi:hypothetical protein